ncbi:MAG TPA: DUF2141 domain-containing protein [Allosphingosinicella sp.]|nr:DUF2141 domain-containing protein [Allosphingosinicella sp.]
MKALLLAAGLGLAAATPGHGATLTVDLDGVRGSGGSLYVSVQTREQFMREGGVAGSVLPSPQAGSHRFQYEVPAGEYAVSVWHDDNGNGAFDNDENFVPLDGWALSNAAQLRGEPTFDQVRTVVGSAHAAIRLAMVYGR